jgi:hypothetical protein
MFRGFSWRDTLIHNIMFLLSFSLLPRLASGACGSVGLASRGAGFRVGACGARGGFVHSGIPGLSGVIAYAYRARAERSRSACPTRQSSGRARLGPRVSGYAPGARR